MDIDKVVWLGYGRSYNGRRFKTFAHIKFKDGKLSITGVEGPLKNGNCCGSAGQIDMEVKDEGTLKAMIIEPGTGWDYSALCEFFRIWHRWHLNDMRAGCEHQKGWGKKLEDSRYTGHLYPTEHPEGILCKPCPVCGYKYGTAWLKEEVPDEIIAWLRALPDSPITPAWV